MRAFASDAKLKLDAALDLFESRTGFLAARGIDVGRIRFSTRVFGRGLDYYTGFVFELHDAGRRVKPASSSPADATTDCSRAWAARHRSPPSGFAVWIERLIAGGSAS